ncbi:MAG: hypothetical protein AAFY41_01590 [Bacteroidota bacterium]
MKKFVLIVISASMIASCNTGDLDFDNVEVQPITGVFAFPLGEASYVMRDILENQTGDSIGLFEDSTSLYVLQYFDTIEYSTPDDFVQINDINERDTLRNIPPATGPTGPIDFSQTFEVQYDPTNQEQLDSLFYLSGELSITTTSTIDGVRYITIYC